MEQNGSDIDAVPKIRCLLPNSRLSFKNMDDRTNMEFIKRLINKSKTNWNKQGNDVGMNTQPAEVSWNSSRSDLNSDEQKDHTISRNVSFGNPNYDYFLEIYNTNANKELIQKQKHIISNNQLFK